MLCYRENEVSETKIKSLKDEPILSSEKHGKSALPKRQQRISTSSRVSQLEKNAWKTTVETANHYDKRNNSKKSVVFKFFFGINDEFKWYSLKGKGMIYNNH